MLAGLLRDAREKAGLTQREVAARLDKSPSYPHKVENAERALNIVEFLDYCTALEVESVTLLQTLRVSLKKHREAQ